MITLDKVLFKYPGQYSFSFGPASLSIEPGRIYAWLGENGSGKSTLARLLAGDRRPLSGSITGLPGRIFYMRQLAEQNIFPELTVWEHLSLAGDTGRRDDVLYHFAEFTELFDSYPDTLSGGQLQRLSFAMVFLRKFEFCIFDEVTNHLDTESAQRVGSIVTDLIKKEKIQYCVFVTHNENFANEFCDKTMYFSEGKVKTHE